MLQIYSGFERKPMYLLPLAAVLQDAGGVIDGPVVFANRQVGALVLVDLNHQVVVLQLRFLSGSLHKGEKLVFSYTNLLSSDPPKMTQHLPKPCFKSEHTGQSPNAFHHRGSQANSRKCCSFLGCFLNAQFLASSSYLGALLLEEFGVNLLADDLGANVILDSNAQPHLFQDELHLLLFLHGAICLHLSREKIIF